MILAETFLFVLAVIGCGCITFLLLYFLITFSDLDCDYINVQECCDKLNYWLLPKYIAHSFITFLFFLHGHFWIFLFNLPIFIWLTFEYFTVPPGNLGAYDPAEIYNSGELKKHVRSVTIQIGYYLLSFFIYLYCSILSLLKEDPINRAGEEEIVTRL